MDTWFQEYRDQNEFSRYPFADLATLCSSSTTLTIPPDAFIDANIYPRVVGSPIYITQISVESESVRLYIGTRRTPQACWTDFDPLDPAERLTLVDEYGRIAGVLLTRPQVLAVAQTWEIGNHTFRDVQTAFAVSCCRPYPSVGVVGFLTDAGDYMSGEVAMVAEDGVVLRSENEAIRVDVVGDPLFKRKLCSPRELFETPRFLQTINLVKPNKYGNIELIVGGTTRADTIVRINATAQNVLTIEAVGKPLSG